MDIDTTLDKTDGKREGAIPNKELLVTSHIECLCSNVPTGLHVAPNSIF